MSSAASASAYAAAHSGAGLIVRQHGLIVMHGRDRASYLQGLLTNDIAALTPGLGCYAAYLTAQGRMISDLHVYELGDAILLTLPPATKDTVLAKLDQFIFSEDVQLADATDAFASLAVAGPAAASVVAAALGHPAGDLEGLPLHGNRRVEALGHTLILLRVDDLGVPAFEIVMPREALTGLSDALRSAGAVDMDDATAHVLRVEAGIPLFGADMDEETIPLEAGLESRAISQTKGCYVGQEIIIRVLHRGHGRVARKLVGLVFDGDDVPQPGTTLHVPDKEVGAVTSSAWSPALGRAIALGYVKRDVAEPGTSVTSPDGRTAQVVALPFTPRS
ncbi:MAG: folate-binding protein YgfZ [Acidobacteria bacterium]|nr:folate-binding protein YgfZ [Acidobacteriota bacterium]